MKFKDTLGRIYTTYNSKKIERYLKQGLTLIENSTGEAQPNQNDVIPEGDYVIKKVKSKRSLKDDKEANPQEDCIEKG